MQRGQPGGWCIILQIQSLGILYTNVPWSCRPYQYSNSITCTDSTIAQTEDERLSTNIWCCGASDVKSWNSPVVPRSEKNSAGWTTQLRSLWPRGAAKKKKQTKRKMRYLSTIPQQWWRIEWVISGRRDRMWWWSLYLWSERLVFSLEDFFCFGRSTRFNSRIFLYFPCYGTNGIAVIFFRFMHLLTLLFVFLILTCLY